MVLATAPAAAASAATSIVSPTAVVTPDASAGASPAATPIIDAASLAALARRLAPPIAGLTVSQIHDTFAEARGEHRHEATDIVAPRGTLVLAVDDGVVAKLFTSVPGGLTVYQFDASGTWCYYYAHLDAYAEGLHEGMVVQRGDPVGYVGTTGNAGETPHLHFVIFALGPERRWWEGTPIDPYPLLRVALERW